MVGKYFPLTPGTAQMVAHMPYFETDTMASELKVKPQSFDQVISDARASLKK
jgi:hypothetical protein